ncbi:MAG TPA: efflux transporter outer membrane subunit [Steroidobacteraceae bacterium]|nr:efflux transporter outer membrane subunit [Steroidobacteraceae bacterium]
MFEPASALMSCPKRVQAPRRFRGALPSAALALATAALGSCAVGPDYHTPQVRVPDHYAAVAAGPSSGATSAADLASWWRALGDPELDSLIERAVKANPDVLIALDRLQGARTYEAGLVGTILPAADASGAYGRGTGSDLTRGRSMEPLTSSDTAQGLNSIRAVGGFDAFWEIDVFGKLRREMQQAHYNAQAAADARNAVLVSVIADVARAYVDLRGLQMRDSVLRAAVDVLQQSLRIVTLRYQRGITNELDVTLAARELATFRAQLAPVEAQIKYGEYTIATLLGQYPEDLLAELAPAQMIPSVPATAATGMPVDLLRRRPDIQQAERELASATAGIGVATADLFPQFIVTGAIGFQRGVVGTADVGKHIWSVGPGAVWPLLDFGQLDAQVQVATLQTRARLTSYKALIQTAVQQVDSDVDSFAAQQASLKSLGDALVASQRAVTLANQRYDRGLTDFLNVVDAEREEYAIQEQYVDAQASVDDQFVLLYRDLGGGWQDFQKLPGIVRPLPAVLAIFRDTLARSDPLHDP